MVHSSRHVSKFNKLYTLNLQSKKILVIPQWSCNLVFLYTGIKKSEIKIKEIPFTKASAGEKLEKYMQH